MNRELAREGVEARLLEPSSTGFSTSVIVCTSHLAKGLEFDRVVIPDATVKRYHTEMDRNLLYVACTRAMHRLLVIAGGTPSTLLPVGAAA